MRCPTILTNSHRRKPIRSAARVLGLAIILLAPQISLGQITQLPTGNATPIQGGVSSQTAPPVGIPQTNLAPVDSPTTFGGPGVVGPTTQFSDPYAVVPTPGGLPVLSGSNSFNTPVTIPPRGGSLFSRIFSRPAAAPMPTLGTPVQSQIPPTFTPTVPGAPVLGPSPGTFAQPGGYSTESVYGTPPQPTYPSTIYPSATPQTLFPNGVFSNGQGLWYPAFTEPAIRCFQGPRFRYTFISGGDSLSSVGVNDFDFSLAFAVPRFFYSDQPLYIVPSFSLHLWDGPNGAIGADLPSKAYSAFLDTGWNSDPRQMFGTEFGLRVGMFSDFDTSNSDSVRVLGKALVHFRLSPTSRLRGGIYYIDRNDVKLVPAFGILCQPDPYTNFDIFFPQPKFEKYCRTIGTRDVWWYIAGDYGGGSWTIQRTDGTSDSIDMNELRVVTGLEWGSSELIRAGRRTGFAEIGYAFNREVEYRFNPQDNFDTNDAFVFRIGIGY